MKTRSSRFDRLVAQYYPAVYSFASRLTDDPREAIALTRDDFQLRAETITSFTESGGDHDRADFGSSTCGTRARLIPVSLP